MRWVCVYTGSSPGAGDSYRAAAVQFAEALAQHELGLVFGGARVGLMGALADAVMARGGQVIGVIPKMLLDLEVAHHGVTDLQIVESMHARKARMAELSDAFVALPGGYGTMEEIFEMMTWRQLALHAKPMGLLNTSGYFDHLMAFLDHMVGEQFLRPSCRRSLEADGDPARLLAKLKAY